jgi:hypothetical protein
VFLLCQQPNTGYYRNKNAQRAEEGEQKKKTDYCIYLNIRQEYFLNLSSKHRIRTKIVHIVFYLRIEDSEGGLSYGQEHTVVTRLKLVREAKSTNNMKAIHVIC